MFNPLCWCQKSPKTPFCRSPTRWRQFQWCQTNQSLAGGKSPEGMTTDFPGRGICHAQQFMWGFHPNQPFGNGLYMLYRFYMLYMLYRLYMLYHVISCYTNCSTTFLKMVKLWMIVLPRENNQSHVHQGSAPSAKAVRDVRGGWPKTLGVDGFGDQRPFWMVVTGTWI